MNLHEQEELQETGIQACLRDVGPSSSSQKNGSFPLVVLKIPVKLTHCKFTVFHIFNKICGNILEQNSLYLLPLQFEWS